MALGIPGLNLPSGVNTENLISGIGLFFGAIITFLFVGVIGGFIFYKRKEKQEYNKKIFWFEEVQGHMVPIDEDSAKELIVPGTSVAVFYIKKKDLYLPRGTRKMGKDAYWYAIRDNREIVNFSMKNLNEDMKEAGLDYDHTDQRYAWVNLREMIKRNYRDKSVVWWKEYKDIIATAIFIIIMTFAFWFLIHKIGVLMGRADQILQRSEDIYKLAQQTLGSGVAPAGG